MTRTHDLGRRAAEAKAPQSIADAALLLTGFYIAGRYPGAALNVTRDDAVAALARAQEVMARSRTATS